MSRRASPPKLRTFAITDDDVWQIMAAHGAAHEARVAAAIRESQPGDVVIVHEERCPLRSSNEAECRCVPLELKIGATG